ncbi:Histone acetyltransferase [Teratosphaeria destructans]|uniref:histone acetyltransferase n=1 Tax=Teratosphaeria destructans TaxID=418781 RepID=A0A9W7SIK1_9PEZI|nr:Histone acetyltransferase [Teratosphaeria destructans]
MASIIQDCSSLPNGHIPDYPKEPGSLKDALNAALVEGFECKARYIHTPPKTCDALFSPLPGQESERTHLASHFLTVSVHPVRTAGSPIATNDYLNNHKHGVLGIGIEILVYTTKHLTTVFVSKADTTGYIPNLPPSRTKAVCSASLKWLVKKERSKHPSRKLVISLFARAQDQYLFPGSVDHISKHVLTDRQLIKWWAKVLDSTFLTGTGHGDASQKQGYLTVPGFTGSELRQFYPSGNITIDGREHWLPGHPLRELAETRGISSAAPPRCLLPRFPDDPKARYIIDLDEEVGLTFTDDAPTDSPVKRRNGQWSVIKDLERFWEAMEFRQECSSGRMVGFLWLVISPLNPMGGAAGDDAAVEESQESSSLGAFSNDPASQRRDDTPTPSGQRNPLKRKRKVLTGPIIPRKPRLKGGSSSHTGSSGTLDGMINPTASGEGLILSKDGYDRAMSLLLKGSDFSKLEPAARTTSRWVADVASIAGIQGDWALDIRGEAKVELTRAGEASGQVHDLGASMVRKKKRKTEDDVVDDARTMEQRIEDDAPVIPEHRREANAIAVNVLGTSTVRKKTKPVPL